MAIAASRVTELRGQPTSSCYANATSSVLPTVPMIERTPGGQPTLAGKRNPAAQPTYRARRIASRMGAFHPAQAGLPS